MVDAHPPAEAELRDYFTAQVSRYQEPEVLTFTHVFLDPDRRGAQTLEDAKVVLAKLATFASPTQGADALGDAFMLQRYYPERSEQDISKLFGREFARVAFGLSTGQWHGPVLSGYGVHLVYVHGRSHAPPPRFEVVQQRVTQDWLDDKREAFNKTYYANLRQRYDVIVDDTPNRAAVTP